VRLEKKRKKEKTPEKGEAGEIGEAFCKWQRTLMFSKHWLNYRYPTLSATRSVKALF